MISEIRFTSISTSDLSRYQALFGGIFGMEVVAQQEIGGRGYEQLWDLPTGTSAQSIIFGKPELLSGRIRLLKFRPLSDIAVRQQAEPWDTGAVKILDFMVSDFERARRALESQKWEWRTEPQKYRLPGGEGETLEGHIQGVDGVILGIIQLFGLSRSRYVEIGDDDLFSEMATSSYLVPNMDQALSFYCNILGLRVAEDVTINQAELQRLIGLPSGVGLRMVLLGSGQFKSGKIGLLKYEGIEGKSLADRAKPPNRGTVMITFETDSISRLSDQLRGAGVRIISPPIEILLEPYGQVQAMTVRAPDGVMLEFFQQK